MDENSSEISRPVVATESSLDQIKTWVGNNIILVCIVGILFANIIFLDIQLISAQKKISQVPTRVATRQQTTCSQSCMAEIKSLLQAPQATLSAVSSLAASLISDSTSTPTPTITLTPTLTPTPSPTPRQQEYFIPIGQGWGSYADWTVVPGMSVTIDPANYGKIEKVYFEATVRIPTGNQTVYVRLYNANTFQSVVGSDLTLSGGTTTVLTSQPITLISGSNTYQVQLKTQLQYLTYIDHARIRILAR